MPIEGIRRTSHFTDVPSIDARDAAALLEIVHDGAPDAGPDPFPPRVLSGLARLIPSDACVGYQEADGASGFRVVELVEVIGTPPSPKTERAFHTLGWQNPMHCRLHAREERVRTRTAAAAYARAAVTTEDADYGSGEPLGSGG